MRKPTLKTGGNAYYDTVFSGLVPVRVTSVRRGDFGTVNATAVVTADHGAYRKGMEVKSTTRQIVPRSAIVRRKLSTRVRTYQVVVDA